jgi:hypothetical protein
MVGPSRRRFIKAVVGRRTNNRFRSAVDEVIAEVAHVDHDSTSIVRPHSRAHRLASRVTTDVLIGTLDAALEGLSTPAANVLLARCVQRMRVTGAHRAMLFTDAPGLARRAQFDRLHHVFFGRAGTVTISLEDFGSLPKDREAYLLARVAAHHELSERARELAATLAPDWAGTLPELLATAASLDTACGRRPL